MTLEEKLKDLIIRRYGTMKAFAEYAGIKYTTLAAIMKRGIMNSTIDNIFTLCHALNISVDALAKGQIIPLPEEDLPKEQQVNDLPDLVDAYVYHIQNNHECTLDDKPVTQEELEYFFKSIDMVFDQMRARRLLEYQKRFMELAKEHKKS